MATTKKQELAVIDFTRFSVAQLPELKGKKEEIASVIEANPIVEIVDNATYESAKKSRTAVRTLRTSLEKEGKDVEKKIKDHVLGVIKKEYDTLVSDVKSAEDSRQEPIDAWEKKKEEEKQEKARLEQQRVDGIKATITKFKENWEGLIDVLKFEGISDCQQNFDNMVADFDRVSLAEFDVLFDREVSFLTDLLNSKTKTLLEQEQIRIDNLLIQEKNAEQNSIQEWQRTWNANIDTLSVSDIADVKSVLVKSKLANLKHYVSGYEEIYLSTEKRLHSQIEFVSKAEEQRIAQEKLDQEKKEFEEKQAEAKFEERCKQLSDLGFVLNEGNGAYQKGLNYLNLEDIRNSSDELWLRELEDAKNVKDFSELETVDASAQEIEVVSEEVVEFPAIENVSGVEFANQEIFPAEIVEGKIFSGETQEVEFEETWDSLYEKYKLSPLYEKAKDGEDLLANYITWLEENYNVPTLKQ